MIFIELTNHSKSRISGSGDDVERIYTYFSIPNPNAFFLRKYMHRGWDGKVHYLSETGNIATGLIPELMDFCKKAKIRYEVRDFRPKFKKVEPHVTSLNGISLRDYQLRSVNNVVTNTLPTGEYFPRGVLKEATNAGKTIMSSAIAKNFGGKAIFLMNSTELFTQALKEIPQFLPGKVGQISSKKIEWNDFMVCMIKTTLNRLPFIKKELSTYDVLIVDECDLSNNKTNKAVIDALWHCPVRVGLSGSVFMSKLKKDELKNKNIKTYFGNLLDEVSNKELITKGHSSPIRINILPGNSQASLGGTFSEEYEWGIIRSKERNRMGLRRAKMRMEKNQFPMLIAAKNHKHIEILYKLFTRKMDSKVRIDWVHHSRKDRHEVVRKFKDGEIDILIGSMILRRGKNFPLMKYMLNMAGGKNAEGVIQLLGRATRKHESKKFTIYEDFMDEGKYLKSHSRKRIIVYKNEGITEIKYVKRKEKAEK